MNALKGTAGLRAEPAALRVQKQPIPLRVHFAVPADLVRTDAPYEGGRIRTRETAPDALGVQFVPGDAIVTGTTGESWPIPRATFEATYQPAPGGAMGEDGAFWKAPLPVLALRMAEPFTVSASWGELAGAAGDWLLQYDAAATDFGVVGAAIFEETYRVLGPATPAGDPVGDATFA